MPVRLNPQIKPGVQGTTIGTLPSGSSVSRVTSRKQVAPGAGLNVNFHPNIVLLNESALNAAQATKIATFPANTLLPNAIAALVSCSVNITTVGTAGEANLYFYIDPSRGSGQANAVLTCRNTLHVASPINAWGIVPIYRQGLVLESTIAGTGVVFNRTVWVVGQITD